MANKMTLYQRLNKVLGFETEQPKIIINPTELNKLTDTDIEQKRLEAQQTIFLKNQWKKIDNELYQKAVYYEPTRIASYYDYESMEYCIAGDTKIATPDGFITIKELADKGRDYEFITYAYDYNLKKVVPAMARNAHYTRDEMTYKVTFDDGSFIITTWEHQLMKRDGSFERVMNLKIGESMMPFYRKPFYDNQKYNWVYTCNPNDGHNGWVPEHNLIAEWYYDTNVNEDEEVHHIDFNETNNLPENLQIMKVSEHRAYHASLNNDEYRRKMFEIAKRQGELSWGNRRFDDKNPAHISVPFDNIVETARVTKTLKKTATQLNISYREIQRDIVNSGYRDWQTFLEAYGIEKSKYSTCKTSDEVINLNHKIISIEPHGVIPVYDLTVHGYKNFATDTIFSHNTPEIAVALDIFADEATTSNENGKILSIYSNSNRIKSELTDLFENVLDINTNLTSWARNVCKYGDNFIYLKIVPNNGIVGVTQLPNVEITRSEPGFVKVASMDNYQDEKNTVFFWKDKGIDFNSFEIAHFRLLGDDRRLPYGTSLLEKSRRIWKQLLLAEDAMLVYRVTRAPERRVYKVFVGNMDDKDIDPYVDKIANNFKRVNMVNSQNGQQDTRYNPLAVDQDYFIPVRDPNLPNPIDTLPGACIALDTKIPLLDGRTLELNEIINEWDNGNRDLWVYSCDPNSGKIKPGQITWAGETRKNAEVIRITLDNGKSVITTTDHKWVHRTKGFVEAKDLTIGDSLMPFYTKHKKIRSNTNEYEQIWDNEKQDWVFTHRMVVDNLKDSNLINNFIFDNTHENINKKIIHHFDYNRFNNNPNNLVLMNGGDHMRYHQSIINQTIWGNPELNKQKISKGLKAHISSLSDEEKQLRYSKNINNIDVIKKTTKKLLSWNADPENLKIKGQRISEAKSAQNFKEKFSAIAKLQWENIEYRDKVFSKTQTITFNDEIYNRFVIEFEKTLRADLTLATLNSDSEFIALFSSLNKDIRSSITNLNEFTFNHVDKMLKQLGYKNFSDWKKSEMVSRGYINMKQWKYFVDKTNKEAVMLYNHKIVSIELLSERQNTGTITVDGNEKYHNYHTFAIESGVFIKNSNLSEIADIEYIQKKLLAALRVPKAFIGFDEATGEGKNLAILDIRFARAIHRIQKSLIQELNKIAIIHLYLKGFEDDLDNFTLSLTNPSTQADLLKIESWTEKVRLYRDAVSDAGNGYSAMSMTLAKKEILGMSDDDIKLDVQRQVIEKAGSEELKVLSEMIKQTGLFREIYRVYKINPDNMTQAQSEKDGGVDMIPNDAGGLGDIGQDFTPELNVGDENNLTEPTSDENPAEPIGTPEETLAEGVSKRIDNRKKSITENIFKTIKEIDNLI